MESERVTAPTIRLEATIRGRVQGVGFRYFVVVQARRLDLAGWVSNEPDGSVRVVAEGSEASIAELENRLRLGPPGAIVDGLLGVRMPPTGTFRGFGVRSAGHGGD